MTSILQSAVSNVLLAAVLAIFALVVGRLWKNQHVAHLLWVIMLAKLVTPPLWNVPIPLAGLVPASVTKADGLAEINAGSLPANFTPIETVYDLSDDPSGSADDSTADAVTAGLAPVESAALAPETAAAVWGDSTLSDWPAMLASLWLVSSALCAVVIIGRVVRFHRLARRGESANVELVQRVVRLANRLGLRRIPDVRLLDAAISPMVWPLAWRKMLLLPRRLVAELTSEQLDTVVAHELAHLVRRDEFVRLLETIVTCLFWWNPVVWFARRELRAAEEDCCDALVVCSLPESRKQYGEALLRAAELITFGRSLPALASAFGQQRFLKRRIAMILNHKFQRSASWQAKLALMVLSLAVLPLAATAMSQQESAAPEQRDRRDGDRQGTKADRGLAQLERTFAGYDTNKDGKVTLEEFIAALGGQDNPKVRATAEQQFTIADRNRDKSVSFEEFLVAGKHRPEGGENRDRRDGDRRGTKADRGLAQLERTFAGYDKNKDGKVTLDEFIAALGGQNNPKVREVAEKQFAVADRDRDKSVSFEEFLAAGKHRSEGGENRDRRDGDRREGDQRGTAADRGLAQLERTFAGYDTNKDGKVTVDEFIAALGGQNNPKVREVAEKQFAVADRDRDKSVSFEEFLAAGKHRLEGGENRDRRDGERSRPRE